MSFSNPENSGSNSQMAHSRYSRGFEIGRNYEGRAAYSAVDFWDEGFLGCKICSTLVLGRSQAYPKQIGLQCIQRE